MSSAVTASARFTLRGFAMPLAIFLLSFIIQVACLPRVIYNIYDEGLIVFGAQRVLEGDIPYRDFWNLYAPGQFYAVAGLFKLFGSSVLVERLWDVAVRAGVTAAAFVWARALGAEAYAYAAACTILLLLAGVGFHGFPIFHALLFGLISGYLVLLGFAAAPRRAHLLAAGAFAGLAALFRHDIGFYVFAAEALALLGQPMFGPAQSLSWRQPLRRIIALTLGALIIVGPVAGWLLIEVPFQDLSFMLFTFPATSYAATRALPFPVLPNPTQSMAAFSESLLVYLPLFAGAAAVFCAVRWRHEAKSTKEMLKDFGIFLLGLITLLAYLKGIVRVSSLHLLQSIVPATVLFFLFLARTSRASSRIRFAAPPIAAAFVFAAAAPHARSAYGAARDNWSALRPFMPEAPRGLRGAIAHICTPRPGFERARCFQPRAEDMPVIEFLQQRVTQTEPIFVGSDRHDRIFVNNIMMYFLAARSSATKWHQFDPDIQTTRTVQQQMIDEFTRRKVRYLVLSSEWSNVIEPNASAISSGVTLLDDYIQTNFTKVQQSGRASVWERRGAAE